MGDPSAGGLRALAVPAARAQAQEKRVQCSNHPATEAADRCAACAEAFCPDCLVEIQGQKYCGSCKVVAVKGQPLAEAAAIPCREARDALLFAALGVFLFCIGFVFGPIALSKAVKARRMMAADPRLTGWGQAVGAIVLAIVSLGMSLMFLIRIGSHSSQ